MSDEFQWITSEDVLRTFNSSLDKFAPGLCSTDRNKEPLVKKMEDLLDELDDHVNEVFSLAVLEVKSAFSFGMTLQ